LKPNFNFLYLVLLPTCDALAYLVCTHLLVTHTCVSSLSGIQQVCVQREAVPLPEESRGNFDGIQQSSVCECSEVLCFSLPLNEVETLLCKYLRFATLFPHGMRQKYLHRTPSNYVNLRTASSMNCLFSLHELCSRDCS